MTEGVIHELSPEPPVPTKAHLRRRLCNQRFEDVHGWVCHWLTVTVGFLGHAPFFVRPTGEIVGICDDYEADVRARYGDDTACLYRETMRWRAGGLVRAVRP